MAQIQEGAPADVFASADVANMDKLTAETCRARSRRTSPPTALQIAVAPDNPLGIAGLADLTGKASSWSICAPEVPCGAAAQKAAEAGGVELTPVSEEQSVTDVLGKVVAARPTPGWSTSPT